MIFWDGRYAKLISMRLTFVWYTTAGKIQFIIAIVRATLAGNGQEDTISHAIMDDADKKNEELAVFLDFSADLPKKANHLHLASEMT